MNAIWKRIRPLLSTFVRFMHISYLETKSDYEGTALGIFWIPVSTLLFTALLGLVFHAPAAGHSLTEFYLYLVVGYVVWNFISHSITKSTNIIQGKFDFAIHNSLTLVGLFGKMLGDRIFELGLNLVLVVLAVLFLSPGNFGLTTLLLIPFLALLSATSLALSYLVNLLTIFYPDFENIIKTAMRALFFATPVFWMAGERTDIRGLLEVYNPASYYLMMGRQVFGVEPLDWQVWGVGLMATLLVSGLAWVAYSRSHAFVRNMK